MENNLEHTDLQNENVAENAADVGINPEKIRAIRKILAADQVASQKDNILPEAAAAISDTATFELDQQKKLADGEITEIEYVENLVDRKTAQFCTWFENNGVELCEKGGAILGNAVGFVLSPWNREFAKKCSEIGAKIGRALGPVVTKVVKKAASMLSGVVKKTAGIIASGANFIKKLFS